MKDMANNIKSVRSIAPITAGTTGTGRVGKPVDRQGFESVTIILDYGAITATAATITPRVKHGDATGALASVADADMISMIAGAAPEASAAIAAGARASGSTMNISKRIGYIGGKRYVSCDLVPTATAGVPVAATVLLGHPHRTPVGA